MNELLGQILTIIKKSGPISLARYMELALQHPDLGYYRRRDPIGRQGDFITAPEVSQMFGELIGLACAETWKAMGKPDPFVLLELGPGRGTLMDDALRATAKISGFHHALQLHFLESNQSMLAMQKEKLAAHLPIYVTDFEQLPQLPTIVIANEFFDALSARQFEKHEDGWRERLVGADGDELEFMLSPPDPSYLVLIPPERREAPAGTVHEVSPSGLSLMRQMTQHLITYDGAALVIDYGYVAPPGAGTLQAVSSHRHADVLERPGEVDLTVHVDFMALKNIAQSRGAVALGPIGQGEFLQTLGIEMRAAQLKHTATPAQAKSIDDALHRLTDPSQMGALFKAMAIVTSKLGAMPGF